MGLSQTCETLKLYLPVSRRQPQGPPSTGWVWEAQKADPQTTTVSQDCIEDSVTPIVLRLNFSLEGQPLSSFGNLRPVLAVDAQTLFTAAVSPGGGPCRARAGPVANMVGTHFISKLYFIGSFHSVSLFPVVSSYPIFFLQFPFEKNCGNDSVCQDDLSISFRFTK